MSRAAYTCCVQREYRVGECEKRNDTVYRNLTINWCQIVPVYVDSGNIMTTTFYTYLLAVLSSGFSLAGCRKRTENTVGGPEFSFGST